jgi:hypothetical protein
MAHEPSQSPVRVTGQERLHPTLRTLGRACIALARWQRDHEHRPAGSNKAAPGDPPPAATSDDTGPQAETQEARDA